jgi:hypothetical protein
MPLNSEYVLKRAKVELSDDLMHTTVWLVQKKT